MLKNVHRRQNEFTSVFMQLVNFNTLPIASSSLAVLPLSYFSCFTSDSVIEFKPFVLLSAHANFSG